MNDTNYKTMTRNEVMDALIWIMLSTRNVTLLEHAKRQLVLVSNDTETDYIVEVQ